MGRNLKYWTLAIFVALYLVVDIEQSTPTGRARWSRSFPSRKAAFEQARDEQRVIATAPVELPPHFTASGYILYSPVYNERGFAGCIVFVYRVDQLLNGFAHGRRIPMNFSVSMAGRSIIGYPTRRKKNRQFIRSSATRSGSATLICWTEDVVAV
jgi:sensor domain CHASE-containing protein